MSKPPPFEPPSEQDLEILGWMLDFLPPIVSRKQVGHYLGGLVSSKTLANHDAKGTGPRVVLQTQLGVAYPATVLLEWIEKKMNAKILLINQDQDGGCKDTKLT
jgi:hypothetical protein